MHILGVKPFARFLESKKLSSFRLEAGLPHLRLRTPERAVTPQASREISKAES
jgi:hypothetical protein